MTPRAKPHRRFEIGVTTEGNFHSVDPGKLRPWRLTLPKSVPRGLVPLAEPKGIHLPTPRITVGLPVYKGKDLIAKALDCLQRQTFDNFEVIISVDGNDVQTATACEPFLADLRFRMIVHRERLDWVGNFNWLLQQNMHEFFCYRQHDDTTAPEFFDVLLKIADKEPSAAAIYCDCQHEDDGKSK